MFLFWVIFLSLFFLGVVFLYSAYYSTASSRSKENLSTSVQLIIPFRNESENINRLVSDLLKFNISPDQILFVNDHSSDDSRTIIENAGFSVIDLKENEQGKKAALIKGVQQSTSDYILFNDVDVYHKESYFNLLKEVPYSGDFDACILPVQIKTRSVVLKGLIQLDFSWLQFLTYSFKGNLGNGANMIVKKESYLKYAAGLEKEFLSGDDYFLLKTIKREKGNVRYLLSRDFMVSTDPPNSINELLSQRARWIQKTFKKGGSQEILFSILWIVFSFTPYVLLVSWFSLGEIEYLVLLLIKLFLDFLIFLPALNFIKRLRLLSLLPLLQFLYPIYYLAVIFRTGLRNKWKDRDL